jgi:hypothetical protein
MGSEPDENVVDLQADPVDEVKRRKRQAFFDRLDRGLLPDLTGPIGPDDERRQRTNPTT